MSSLSFSSLPISPELLPPRFSFKTVSAACLLVFFGSITVILFRLQTAQYGLSRDAFTVQAFCVFAGQYLNLLFFYLRLRLRRKAVIAHFHSAQRKALFSAKSFRFSRRRLFVAALLNFLTVVLQLRLLTFLSPLLFQMLLGVGAVFTPLISRVWLRQRLYPHTWLGIVFCLLGLAATFATAYFFAVEDIQWEGSLALLTLLALSLLSSSCQSVYEEWLTDKLVISSFRFAGLEGLYGLLFLTGAAATVQLIPAIRDRFSLGAAVWEVLSSPLLAQSCAVLVGASALHGLCAILLTKKLSATFRMMTDILKVTLVWLGQFLFFEYERPTHDLRHYLLFSSARLAAYGLLVFGNVLINEVGDCRCCGLGRNWGRYTTHRLNANSSEDSEEYSIIKF